MTFDEYKAMTELLVGHPELQAALQADYMRLCRVSDLNRWVAADPGNRRWYFQPEVAGFVGCVLVDNARDPNGDHRSRYTAAQVKKLGASHFSWENSWTHTFGRADDIEPFWAAAQYAAQAINDGNLHMRYGKWRTHTTTDGFDLEHQNKVLP